MTQSSEDPVPEGGFQKFRRMLRTIIEDFGVGACGYPGTMCLPPDELRGKAEGKKPKEPPLKP